MASSGAMFAAAPESTDAQEAGEYVRAVQVLDDELDMEGKAVNAAADELQSLLAPSPTIDGELEAREADAAYDEHHARLVASASALRQGLVEVAHHVIQPSFLARHPLTWPAISTSARPSVEARGGRRRRGHRPRARRRGTRP